MWSFWVVAAKSWNILSALSAVFLSSTDASPPSKFIQCEGGRSLSEPRASLPKSWRGGAGKCSQGVQRVHLCVRTNGVRQDVHNDGRPRGRRSKRESRDFCCPNATNESVLRLWIDAASHAVSCPAELSLTHSRAHALAHTPRLMCMHAHVMRWWFSACATSWLARPLSMMFHCLLTLCSTHTLCATCCSRLFRVCAASCLPRPLGNLVRV